ncbi:hypothetical protein A2U01_0007647, partial [Trifolium medium]|nr:hypothetical protein [Trifolium medium]
GSSSSSTGLSQEKYDQLISLLQQANLVPSAPSSNPSSTSNSVSASSVVHDGHSPHDASSAGQGLPEDDWFG